MLGEQVQGILPESIAEFRQLTSLSMVETHIRGVLPAIMGTMSKLVYLWLDHNPHLGGEIPVTMLNMTQLYAFEIHYSNFTGKLPPLQWQRVADCALQGNKFSCPLPPGASTCGASCE